MLIDEETLSKEPRKFKIAQRHLCVIEEYLGMWQATKETLK